MLELFGFDLSLFELTIICSVALLAALVQTTIGFGYAIVSAPLLFLIEPSFVPPVVTVTTAVNTLFTIIYFRSHLSLTALLPALITRVPGSVCGAALLWLLTPQLLALVIAAAIMVAIGASYFRVPLALSKRNLAIAGFLSGLMGTATSIGGPPIVILMQGQEANRIRSQLAAFFLFSAIVSLIILTIAGQMSASHWLISLPMIVPVLIGSWLGVKVGKRLPDKGMRRATLGVCMAAVAIMLLRTFG